MTYTVWIVAREQLTVAIDSQDRFGPRGRFMYACKSLARTRGALMAGDCSGPRAFMDGSLITIPT